MTVTIYDSTDVGAPTLTSAPGSLIAVLDACLVNGYGSQVGAGWSKPFIGTNLAVFRQGTGNRMYLRIDDTLQMYARVVGYETMTGINTSTGKFPLEGQFPGGLYMQKSNIVDGNSRGWKIIATSKAFYLWINASNTLLPYGYSQLYFFGDIASYKSNDAFNTLVIANTDNNYYSQTIGTLASALSTTIPGHYMARSYTQIGSSIQVGKHSDSIRGAGIMGRGSLQYPNVIDQSIVLAPVWVHEPANSTYPIRGTMPGLWNICHTAPFSHGDTFVGDGPLVGKTFMAISSTYSGDSVAQCAIEISNTW